MSSASSYAYQVQEEQMRRRRELQAARDDLLVAHSSYERLRQETADQRRTWGETVDLVAGHGVAVGSDDIAALRSAAKEVRGRERAARTQLDDQVVAARIEALRSGIASRRPKGTRTISAAEAIEQAGADQAEEDRAAGEAEVAETVARIVSRLDPQASADVVAAVQAEAAALAAGSPGAVELGTAALRLQVQRANRAAREERSRTAELEAGEVRLNGFDGPAAAAARRLIASVRDGRVPMPLDLTATVEAAIEQERRAQEGWYVAEQLHAALADLGYEVGDDFETALLDQGYTQFGHAGWPGYAVRVRAGGRPPHLNFNVVRGPATRVDQADRDHEVEREFCDRQPQIIAELARGGIAAERTRVVEPGEMDLQEVEGLGEATEARREGALREMGS